MSGRLFFFLTLAAAVISLGKNKNYLYEKLVFRWSPKDDEFHDINLKELSFIVGNHKYETISRIQLYIILEFLLWLFGLVCRSVRSNIDWKSPAHVNNSLNSKGLSDNFWYSLKGNGYDLCCLASSVFYERIPSWTLTKLKTID